MDQRATRLPPDSRDIEIGYVSLHFQDNSGFFFCFSLMILIFIASSTPPPSPQTFSLYAVFPVHFRALDHDHIPPCLLFVVHELSIVY